MQSGRMRSSRRRSSSCGRHGSATPKDIYVEATLTGDLERLGARFEPSRYPGLVRLIVEEPEHELISRLAAQGIVPSRIEPRVSLVSVYLEMTGGASTRRGKDAAVRHARTAVLAAPGAPQVPVGGDRHRRVVLLLNGIMQSQMKGMLESGVRYDIATRRAAAALDAYAEQIRGER
jgi:hypothetical protein